MKPLTTLLLHICLISQMCLLPLMAPQAAYAQDAAPGTVSPAPAAQHEALSITRAIEISIAHNPGAQVTHEKLNELDSDVAQAYSMLFPNVVVTGSLLEKKDPVTNPFALFSGNAYNSYTLGLQVTQPLWTAALLPGISLAKSNQTNGGLNDLLTQQNLALNVIQAFYSIILYQRNLSALLNEQKIDEELVGTIKKYYRVGRNQLLDVLQTETQVAAIIPQIAQAKNQVQIAATQLATYLGDRNANEIEVIGNLDPPQRKVLEGEMKTSKLVLPQNALADEALKQVDYNRTIAFAADLPQFSAVAGWGRAAYVKTDLLNDDATNWSFGLQLTIPVFSGLSTVYKRKMFASQEAQATITRTGTYDTTTLTQVQALKNLDIAEDSVNTSQIAYKIAQDSMKEATRSMRLGTINLLQYQTSEQAMFASEVTLDQSRYTYIADLCQYAIAMGYSYRELLKHLENRHEN